MKSINIFILVLSLVLTNDWVYAGSSDSVRKGIEQYEQGKYEDAMKNFIDAQLERPELPELYYNIGSTAYKKEDYETALSNLARAKEILKNSNDDNARSLRDKSVFNLGSAKYRMGDLDGAVKEFEEIPKTSGLYNEARENIDFLRKKIEEQKKDKEEQKNNKDKQDNKEEEKKKDSKEQNQDNKEGKERKEQKPQEKKEQNKKQEEQKQGEQKSPEPENQQKDKQQEQKPENAKQGEQKAGEEKKDSPDDNRSAGQQNLQHLLNRLEDKPGSAMMPVYSEKQPVSKDW